MRTLSHLALALMLAVLPQQTLADDVTLVVSRNTETASVYLAAPADIFLVGVAAAGFDVRPHLTSSQSFAEGHEVAATAMSFLATQSRFVTQEIDVTPVALPTLLHAGKDTLPYETPFAASLATAVCSTPTAPLIALDDLQLYGGLRAEITLRREALELQLPPEGFAGLAASVRVFEQGTLVEVFTAKVRPDGRLALVPPHTAQSQNHWFAMGVLLLTLLFTALTRSARRRQADVQPQG